MTRHYISFFLLVLFQVTSSSCAAQTEECITSNWNEGEKYSFRLEGMTQEVNSAKDTTIITSGTYDFDVCVLKADKNGYKMRLDYPTSLYASNMDIDLSDIGDMIPIEYETDEFGIFERVTNTNFLINLSNRIIDAAIKLPQLSSMDEGEVRAVLKSYMSPERMIQSFTQDINVLFWMYGIAVKNGEQVTYESEVDMGGVSIPTTTSVSFETNNVNNLYRVDMVMDYDSKSLFPFISQSIGQLVENVQDRGEYNQIEFEEYISSAKMSIVDYYHSEISIATTWPLMSSYIRKIVIEAKDGRQEKIQKRLIYALGN